MDEQLKKLLVAAHLLPAPGGEVVRGLIVEIDRHQSAQAAWFKEAQDRNTEIQRLRLGLSRQIAYLDKQIDELHDEIQNDRFGGYRYEDLEDQRKLLMGVRDENRRIARDLKLEGRVHTEYTEEGVPMLPIPDFCTLYRCVQTSYRANYEGGKYNCIGDETRRLAKNEGGFLTCPTCHNSYGSG